LYCYAEVRRLLQRKWPIWGKLLLKNKMRAEVTSYRLAINEAWEVLEGTLPQDTLQAVGLYKLTLSLKAPGFNPEPEM
jgi:hypothetical protein